jgi:tetratricopeptide (TPR) repeat protein
VALVVIAAISSGTPTAARQQKATPWVVPWLTEYANGAYSAVAKRLSQIGDAAQLERDLETIVTTWTTAKGANQDERRRSIAAFALEAAYVRLDQPAAAARLIEWGCRQIRRIPKARAGEFERYWHMSAFALLSGAVQPQGIELHATHVKLMFPDEPRLAYERAVAEELRAAPFFESGKATPADVKKHYEESAKRYREAARVESVRAEAMMRLGRIEIELGRPEAALTALETVEGSTRDGVVRYLGRLFRGRALERLNRDDEAATAYRSALELAPGAQSAMMSLAALQFSRGERDEADATIADLLGRQTPAPDPWWVYWPADFRHIDFLVNGMREAMK